jgi:hypothetical protein
LPFRTGQFGLAKDSVAPCEAVLSIDRSQINIADGFIGQVDAAALRAVIRAIGYVIESECEPI